MRVVIAGAGVFGACLAVSLARAGARVTLVDPAPVGANASGVAAGMLAPVFESLFDDRPDHFRTLMAARDLWPAFAPSVGIRLERPGALAVTPDATTVAGWESSLADLGAPFAVLSPARVAEARPDMASGLFGLAVEDDWRLDPAPALNALLAAARESGAEFRRTSVTDFTPGAARLDDGSTVAADALVIATGAAPGLAPELSGLTPIKGHILELVGTSVGPQVVRFEGGYICPTAAGCLVGATMETGLADTAVDPEQVATLRRTAERYAPDLSGIPATARTGVRAATADGLPIVGSSVAPGIWLAVGARRNGWLLGPMVARTLTERMLAGG